ncbi:hypothetical protein [Nannocystis sp. SCPEA4]|uniref:hypothetical protein n=1 Tax=Nannocystis sp. SCPEA4 TaxID=2996787 RepID=UPI00226FD147|nr:hypothetical protein [Nannocystis sp. SCPEA4]MCY1057465.1 hypothetical protein [Nannocystis sp. SCPEA4]
MTLDRTQRFAGAALAVSAFSIALALFAYWRSGGKQDAERTHAEIRADIDSLREKQTELVQRTRASLDSAYAASHDRLTRLRETLRIEKDRVEAGMRAQLERADADVNRLASAIETAARTARDSTIAAAEQTEKALTRRSRALEGRVALLRAKYKVRRAQVLSEGHEYVEATRVLANAADLLDVAEERLTRDHDPALGALRLALHEAAASVQAHAIDTRDRLEEVLRKTDGLVKTLEDEEDSAAGRVVAPGRPST